MMALSPILSTLSMFYLGERVGRGEQTEGGRERGKLILLSLLQPAQFLFLLQPAQSLPSFDHT